MTGKAQARERLADLERLERMGLTRVAVYLRSVGFSIEIHERGVRACKPTTAADGRAPK